MNAFEIYDAAFDAANDHAEVSPEYVMNYAENGMNVIISRKIAELICTARNEFDAGEQGSNNFWHIVRKPLEAIEV